LKKNNAFVLFSFKRRPVPKERGRLFFGNKAAFYRQLPVKMILKSRGEKT